MGTEHRTRKQHEPVGPFAPPLPSEAEQQDDKPMAVAGDEMAQQEAFKPTTANLDQMDADTAKRYRDPQLQREEDVGHGTPTPHGKDPGSRHDENKAQEDPEGYEASSRSGYRRLEDEP